MPSTLRFLMKQHLISTDQVLNVPRSNEPVATHTIFTETLEVTIDVQQTQVFMGRDCSVTDIYLMTSGKHFVNTVEKLQFSLFLISCCQGILNFSWLSWYLVLKIACFHVSFTTYENLYKL